MSYSVFTFLREKVLQSTTLVFNESKLAFKKYPMKEGTYVIFRNTILIRSKLFFMYLRDVPLHDGVIFSMLLQANIFIFTTWVHHDR